MPIALYSFRKTSDGLIMFHGFLAPNAKAAAKMEQAHAAVCPQFGPALAAEQTIEIEVELDELPEFEDSSLEEFLDLDDDDPDLDDDEEEEDEEPIDVKAVEEEEDGR
jgi:hypothetical protein